MPSDANRSTVHLLPTTRNSGEGTWVREPTIKKDAKQMDEKELQAAIAPLPAHLQAPVRLTLLTGWLLEQLQTANEGALKSRELSLAITNIEQGGHWLTALIARLDEGR